MAKIGYARVSTRDQNPDAQVDAETGTVDVSTGWEEQRYLSR